MGRRTWTASVVAIAVLAVLGTLPTATSAQEPARQPVVPVGSPSPQSAAEQLEASIEVGDGTTIPDVEMPHMRSATTKVFSTEESGVWRAEIASAPVHWFDGALWQNIDAVSVPDGAGGFTNGANSFDLTVSADPSEEVARLDLADDQSVGWSLEGADDVAAVQEDPHTVVFDDVLEDVSLEVVSHPDGAEQTLILDSPAAPDSYDFPLALEGLSAAIDTSGAVELTDAAGEVALVMPPGSMADSSRDDAGEPAFSDGVTYALVDEGGTPTLRVQLDREWLDDPERTYPVLVDPSATLPQPDVSGIYDDTYLAWGGTKTRNTEALMRMGVNYVHHRSFLRFDVAAAATAGGLDLDSTDIVAASLSLKLTKGTCAPGAGDKVQIRPMTAAWPSVFDGADWGWSSTNSGPAIAPLSEACNAGRIALEGDGFADLVESWLASPPTNHGLMLRPVTEPGAEKSFASANSPTQADWPTLSVLFTYKRQYLRVSGDDTAATEFTQFAGPDCYPEPGASTGWGADCRLDLYWAGATPPDKAIVLVHGGGWLQEYSDEGGGTFHSGRRNSTSMAQYADALAHNGYLVAVVDYRQHLWDYVANDPNNVISLVLFTEWFHCTQRWEPDDSQPQNWPPPSTWSGTSPLPANCSGIGLNSVFSDFTDEVFTGVEMAVDDVQSAVAWLRSDTTTFSGDGFTDVDPNPSTVFVLGHSAGAFTAITANYDAASTGAAAIDGTVAVGGSNILDGYPIRDLAGRGALAPAAAGPLQIQITENDVAFAGTDQFRAGYYDFARQTYQSLRDQGYAVDLRTYCGWGHIPSPDAAGEFSRAVGETLTFFDALAQPTPVNPMRALWHGESGTYQHYSSWFAADMMEPTGGAAFEHRVGDFNGDGTDDIFWFGDDAVAGDLCDSVWYSQNNPSGIPAKAGERASFARLDPTDLYGANGDGGPGIIRDPLDNNPGSPPEALDPTALVVGDFDGDGYDDLSFLTTGAGADGVWYGVEETVTSDLPEAGSFDRRTSATAPGVSQSGLFDAVAVGDFNGDGFDDLYFDETDAGDDMVWFGTTTRGSFSPAANPISLDPEGAYDLLVGDFDGDGRDDIYFSSATLPDDQLWYGTADAAAPFQGDANTAPAFANGFGYEVAVVGNFDDNARADIFFHDNDVNYSPDKIFYGSGSTATKFVAENEASSLEGPYTVAVGDFNGDGATRRDDLIFRSDTDTAYSWEFLYRAKASYASGQGFLHRTLWHVASSDRDPIVGEFGAPSGIVTPRADVLWHHTGNRGTYPVIPEGGWWWCPCDP